MQDMSVAELEKRPEIPGEKLDAIVVLGHNIGTDWGSDEIRRQRFHLSPHSRINVLAAGVLYRTGIADKIILSTGNAGKDYPSEASAMKDQLKRIFKNIPDSAIILEEESWDTRTNAKEVKRIMEKHGFENIGLITIGIAHLKRAIGLFEREGLTVTPFASERVLKKLRPTFVKKYLSSSLVQKEMERDNKAFRIQFAPVVGPTLSAALSLITRITRAH